MKDKKESLWKSFRHAAAGIKRGVIVERNLLIHVVIMCLVVIAGLVFSISVYEWLTCVLLFGLVISLELVNTAIENTVDIATSRFHEKAKIAKDTAAGAVLVTTIVAIIIGLIIFVPKILDLFGYVKEPL